MRAASVLETLEVATRIGFEPTISALTGRSQSYCSILIGKFAEQSADCPTTYTCLMYCAVIISYVQWNNKGISRSSVNVKDGIQSIAYFI